MKKFTPRQHYANTTTPRMSLLSVVVSIVENLSASLAKDNTAIMGISCDTIREIDKSDLKKIFANPKLKNVERGNK